MLVLDKNEDETITSKQAYHVFSDKKTSISKYMFLCIFPVLGVHSSLQSHGYKYKIDYTQEWVMRLCNPRVCGYPEAKPRDKCKQVGYCA